MILPPQKFVGSTEECFRDLITNHPEVAVIELIGELCCEGKPATRTNRVMRWKDGRYPPTGLELLKLRCFLHLADYEVTELMRLNAEIRKFAFTVSLCPLDPKKTNTELGYEDAEGQPGALWRILLRGQGYNDDAKKKAKNLVTRHQKTVDQKIEKWQKRIVDVIGDTKTSQQAPAEDTISLDQIDQIATIFGHNIRGAITAGRMLIDADAEGSLLSATRGGLDLMELKDLLEHFL